MGDVFLSELKRDRYPPVTGRKDHSQVLRGHHLPRLVEIYLSHEGREIYLSHKKNASLTEGIYISRAKRDISLARKGVSLTLS
jgi:hypothetical protein